MARRTPNPDFSRLRTTLMGGKADRVPILEHTVDRPVKEAFLGRKLATVADDVEFWVEAGYDHYIAGLRPMCGLETASGHSATMKVQQCHYSVYGNGASSRAWVEEGCGAIDSWEAFEAYPWLTPDDIDLSGMDEAAAILPAGMRIIPLYGCIFNGAQWLMGFENLCIKLCEDPELVIAVIERTGEVIFKVLERAVEKDKVGALWYADDLAFDGGLMASPDFLRKHVLPWMQKIGELCRQKDLPYIYHTDGDVSPLLDDFIDCGINCLQPIEPKVMDIAEVRKRYGTRLALAGNIDLGYTLTLGSPEQVAEEVRKRIDSVGADGAYCVGSSNSVTDYVPVNNFRAMLDATFKYGAY